MDLKFFKCNVCGQIISIVNDTELPVRCCMRDMEELVPNSGEGNTKTHIPISAASKNKITVCVGAEDHPMKPEHHIEWVAILTNKGMQRKRIAEEKRAKVDFYLEENELVFAIYAYCNIHGLYSNRIMK